MNKKRKREILIFAVLIIILGTWRFGGFQQIYLSPSKVMYACERGLHYGPSKKVLLEYKQGRDCLVIGKVDDRNLSVVPARKTLLGMWKMKSGMITAMNGINYENDRVMGSFSQGFSLAYGLTDLENADKISFVLEYKDNTMPDFEKTERIEADVDKDGFYYVQYKVPDDDKWYYVKDIDVYNKSGNIIYTQEYGF